MTRTLVFLGCFFLSGCTGVGLFANSVADLGRDAQIDALEEQAKRGEQERKTLEARLAALQKRVDQLAKEEARRAAEASKPAPATTPPGCAEPAIDVAAVMP
jgi:cell division protein FtsB